MRTFIATVTAVVLGIAASAAEPERIVFARVFPNAGQIGVFIAAADGSGERPLVTPADIDYDPVWSPDGASIVFTSDREGSADLFRVKPDGTGLERLTDDAAYDDQAAFSPDGQQLAFVSSRQGGYARLWIMSLQTKQAVALTTGKGGDFRPSWSADGRWIAFSSDRDNAMAFSRGRWEHLQTADVYIVHPDGTGLKKLTASGDFCGSPRFSTDNTRLLAYCMSAQQTLEVRRPNPRPGYDTRLVSIDVASGVSTDVAAGPGTKLNPAFLPGGDIGYVRKDGDAPGIFYTSGKTGPKGNVRTASWSPDGARVVYHKRLAAPATAWLKAASRNPNYELTFTGILPAFNAAGDKFVVTGRPAGIVGATLSVVTPGTNKFDLVYEDKTRNVLAPQWSPDGKALIFGIGHYEAFFNGFVSEFMKKGDRVEGGAQIAMVNADGSGFRTITDGKNNDGFPSMAPDGKRFVYRSFGPDGEGLRIMNLDTKAVTKLTEGYDNFPLWSPRGDLIMFSRAADGDYEIYTIKPDGTGAKRLTFLKGNDAHMSWSPDGSHIVWAGSFMGFKDESAYTDGPQPYGELFVMRADGTDRQQLTDNQWEEGTPAWKPR